VPGAWAKIYNGIWEIPVKDVSLVRGKDMGFKIVVEKEE
jgi:hypothetical protein